MSRLTGLINLLSNTRFWLFICILVVFVVMSPNMNNDWVNWDDDTFVLENQQVTNLSSENIKDMFTSVDKNGGYTPLTVFSWSLDYSVDEFNPHIFHITNVLLHLVNVCLVFFFIFLLSGKLELAVLTALLFGVHPVQLEAVAWITSRKDLLYGLFYLAGLICYLKYIKSQNKSRIKLYLICLLLFIGALFSKGMAVTFPLSLLLIDFYYRRSDIKRVVIEKVPFFILSLIFGLIAISGQQEVGAIDDVGNISFIKTFFMACYGFVMYIVKSFIPYQLSAYHPYPISPNEELPLYIYLFVIPVVIYIGAIIYSVKKNRLVGFSLLFYLCSIVLVLQFIPVGLAIISERFSYVANVGLFFLFAFGISYISMKLAVKKQLIYGLVSFYIGVLSIISFNRSDVWRNSESLWTDVIEKYPEDFLAYSNRGLYYSSIGKVEQAISDYTFSLTLHPEHIQTYHSRGLLYMSIGDLEKAWMDMNRVISLDGSYMDAYINRGLIFLNTAQYEEAMKDFDYYVSRVGETQILLFNRGLLYSSIQDNGRALSDFSKVIEMDPGNTSCLSRRGDIYYYIGDLQKAKEDYLKCLEIDPEMSEANFGLGRIYLNQGNYNKALDEFEQSVAVNNNFAKGYVNIGLIYLNQGKYELALKNLNKAISIDSLNSNAYFNRGLVYFFLEKMDYAISDFTQSLLLDSEFAEVYFWRSKAFIHQGKKQEAYKDATEAVKNGYAIDDNYLNSLSE